MTSVPFLLSVNHTVTAEGLGIVVDDTAGGKEVGVGMDVIRGLPGRQ